MQNTGLIMKDCQKFWNMKARKIFPKKAFPPHCAKRHVNLEMGYSWYNTVIWAKRKSAPTLSKCVSQIWCLQGPISNTFPQIPSIYCCCWAVVYHVCICILFMQGPLLCASTDYGVTSKACLCLEVAFFQKVVSSHKQIFQITILSLKFELVYCYR